MWHPLLFMMPGIYFWYFWLSFAAIPANFEQIISYFAWLYSKIWLSLSIRHDKKSKPAVHVALIKEFQKGTLFGWTLLNHYIAKCEQICSKCWHPWWSRIRPIACYVVAIRVLTTYHDSSNWLFFFFKLVRKKSARLCESARLRARVARLIVPM